MIIFPINIHINQVPLSKIILEITIQLTTYTTYLHKLLIIKKFKSITCKIYHTLLPHSELLILIPKIQLIIVEFYES